LRLTRFDEVVSSGGCAAKVGSSALAELLSCFGDEERAQQLLVGLDERDDAAVWKLDGERALVLTVDFSPPTVADARHAGALAVANAFNDIYATGAQASFCLNILGVSPDVDSSWYKAMHEGALERIHAAGALIVGGHTIHSPEPLYGFTVVGFIAPDRVWRLSGARPGDALVLTKPLGCGVLFSAARCDGALAALLDDSLPQMITLHSAAVSAMAQIDVHAATDISGFGLAGHALELARASGVSVEIYARRVHLYPGVRQLLQAGWTTRITDQNWTAVADDLFVEAGVDPLLKAVLFDPQTAGGLLLAVGPSDADCAVRLLHQAECSTAVVVGTVSAGSSNRRLLTVRAAL
jgi:selenide,water dikinase